MEELYGARYQSGSFSLFDVGSGFHCLRSLFYFFSKHSALHINTLVCSPVCLPACSSYGYKRHMQKSKYRCTHLPSSQLSAPASVWWHTYNLLTQQQNSKSRFTHLPSTQLSAPATVWWHKYILLTQQQNLKSRFTHLPSTQLSDTAAELKSRFTHLPSTQLSAPATAWWRTEVLLTQQQQQTGAPALLTT